MINYDAINQFIGSDWKYIENDCFAVFRKASKAAFNRDIPAVDLPEISNLKCNAQIFSEAMTGDRWERVTTPQAGDAVFFYNADDLPVHIGLYVENGDVLHCPGTIKKPLKTIYENLREMNRFVYRRFEYYRPCI